MNKKFLNRVVDHIVKETRMDCQALSYRNTCWSAFFFSCHCKGIYALNEKEIAYVWNEYGNIINDKINE